MRNSMFNASGCKDETAFKAIENVTRKEKQENQQAYELLKLIKGIVKLSDFELIERISLKHVNTGKEYR